MLFSKMTLNNTATLYAQNRQWSEHRRHGRLVSTGASYSKGRGFKSGPGDVLTGCGAFLRSLRKNVAHTKVFHDCFLPYPTQFTFH